MSQEIILVLDADHPLMEKAFALRLEVFVEEQNVPRHLELDGADADCVHIVAIRDDRLIATLRIQKHGSSNRIGRIAVRRDFRRQGIGSRMISRAIEDIRKSNDNDIVLHAQVGAIGFYRNLGFVEEGKPDTEAGIEHIWMRKRFLPENRAKEQRLSS